MEKVLEKQRAKEQAAAEAVARTYNLKKATTASGVKVPKKKLGIQARFAEKLSQQEAKETEAENLDITEALKSQGLTDENNVMLDRNYLGWY